MDSKKSPLQIFFHNTRKVLFIAAVVIFALWLLIIFMSNRADSPIVHPAPEEFLSMGFNPDKSLKFCVFSLSKEAPAELGAVVMYNGAERILPVQKSYSRHYDKAGFQPFSSAMDLISAIDTAKVVSRELFQKERESGYPTPLYRESEVTLHPFIQSPAKMLHGTNSRAHHRNAKRLTVKGWMPFTAKTILNPYNYLTKDSFYAETNEEPEFGFFHGNNIDLLTTGDTLELPEGMEKIDIEGELAMVIGKRGARIDREDAESYVAGYLMFNDFSDRVAQDKERLKFQGYQKSKYISGLGAWFLTDIEPEKFTVRAKVNGKEVFTACNDEIIEFLSVAEQIVHYSHYGTLVPGTVIAMGTMAGGSLNELELSHLIPGDRVELVGNQGFGSFVNYIEQ